MKILIVDDSADYRKLLCDVFTENGWEVVDAPEGRTGLSRFQEESPDVVLSDILMPRMDGFEFLREVRQTHGADVTFVFYTSAFERKADEEFALSLGADAYITEALDPDQVFALVRVLAGEKPKRAPGRRALSEEEFLRKHSVILSQALLEKFTRLRAEEARRKKAEDELRRVKEKMSTEREPSLSPRQSFEACPFAVSDEIHAPLEKIAESTRRLELDLHAAGESERAAALVEIATLARRLTSCTDELLQAGAVSKEQAFAPVRRTAALLGELRTELSRVSPGRSRQVAEMREQLSVFESRLEELVDLMSIWRAELRREEIDLSALARSVANELRHSSPQRKVELAVEPDLRVKADRELIRRALAHLLDNAWKFTSRREAPAVQFGTTAIGGRTVFFVRDNGIGFDMGCADALFTAFSKLHTDGAFPGSGVGLALVKTVVRRHGGTVWAVGEPGAGATFYFSLQRL